MNDLGLPSYHTRVERWQCDFNDHWNLRFFFESFQMAAEVAATRPGGLSPGADIISSRHIRLHRELFVATPVQVRSARLVGGPPELAACAPVVHLLYGGGELSATALDFPGEATVDLPEIEADAIPQARPRGITDAPALAPPSDRTGTRTIPLGPLTPADLDHAGLPSFGALIRFCAIGAHDFHNRLGFTPDLAATSRITRMTLETWLTRGQRVAAGRILHVTSWLARTGGRTFTTSHQLCTDTGETVAVFAQCLAAVDLDARRIVDLPDFLASGPNGSRS